jgi:hypothetical protein
MEWEKPVMSRTFVLGRRSVAPVTERVYLHIRGCFFFLIRCPVPDQQPWELLFTCCGLVIDATTCTSLP